MRVFVTGATGFVGSAIVQELLGAGHQVLGLARSDSSARALIAAGAAVHPGSLEDLDSLRSGAAAADGVIHTAFNLGNSDFPKYVEICEIERHAIEALGAVLEGSDHPLIVTSGVIRLLASDCVGTEDDDTPPISASNPRAAEVLATSLAARGVRASVVRLPVVHGRGDRNFVPALIAIARKKGMSAYVGTGLNRVPAVHRLDAARLYRLAIEQGAIGVRYHAIAEEGIPFKDIAEVIGRHLNLPVVAISSEETVAHFGPFGLLTGRDFPASSERTRALLGWEPKEHRLIADIESPDYYEF